MIKSKFGERLRSKTETAQVKRTYEGSLLRLHLIGQIVLR
jgi:hypothetical protein